MFRKKRGRSPKALKIDAEDKNELWSRVSRGRNRPASPWTVVDVEEICTVPGLRAVKESTPPATVRRLPAWSGDGLDLGHPLSICRDRKCSELLEIALEAGSVLVRAPPSAGKTATATLTARYAEMKGCKVYCMTLLDWNRSEHSTIPQFFASKFKENFFNIMYEAKDHDQTRLLVIDELQIAYSFPADPIWNYIKSLSQHGGRSIHIIGFAAYGESPSIDYRCETATPVQFNETRGLAFLRLNEDEWIEICARFNRFLIVPMADAPCAALYHLTNGHCSFLLEAVRFIRDSVKGAADTARYMGLILGCEIMERWATNRSLHKVIPNLDNPQWSMIRLILNADNRRLYPGALSATARCVADQLTKRGILCDIGGGALGFAAHIVETIMIGKLLAGSFKTIPASLQDLTMQLLPCFSRRQVNDLKNGGIDGRVFERAFQMEFFRCSYHALGSQHGICQADVGKIFGSSGYLDLYIDNQLKWGIELLRESDRLKAHVERFEPGGIYENIPMNDHVILNFVRKDGMNDSEILNLRFAKPKYQKEVRVYYNRGCSYFMVFFHKGKGEKILLLSQ